MPAFGYKKAVVNEQYGLLELSEVSLEFNPADLRRIAAFLLHHAEMIESSSWHSDHAHLEGLDVEFVVLHPEPPSPSRVE